MSERIRRWIVYGSTLLLCVLLVRSYYFRGGPWFEIPETILDHVYPEPPLSRQAIVMSVRAEPLMPRGASVTVIAPALAPNYDFTHYLTACGMLPRHDVRHPTLAPGEEWPDYVIALGAALQHEGYRVERAFPEGALYRRAR